MKSLLATILGVAMSIIVHGVTFGIKQWLWSPWPAMSLCGAIVTLLCIHVTKSWMYDDEEHGVVLHYMLLSVPGMNIRGCDLRDNFEAVTGRTLSYAKFYAIMATLEKDGKVRHRDEQDEHGTVRLYRAI